MQGELSDAHLSAGPSFAPASWKISPGWHIGHAKIENPETSRKPIFEGSQPLRITIKHLEPTSRNPTHAIRQLVKMTGFDAMIEDSVPQDKQAEVALFDQLASSGGYDVFTPDSSERLIATCLSLTGLKQGDYVADLGCGSGTFTDMLRGRGLKAVGLDISPGLLELGRTLHPGLELLQGDVERLPFESSSLDGVFLSGIVHHLPDPSRCANEVFRVLKPGGRFVAFDPNRLNPFMYLYRDRTSPFYSSIGVTPNERPVLAHQIAATFRRSGLTVNTDYIFNLRYRYLASAKVRWLLSTYNAIESTFFRPRFMRPFRSFVLTYGHKP